MMPMLLRASAPAPVTIVELQTAINRYLAEHNQAPRPFTWTRSADAILDRLAPIPASSV
jgi:hypothetical protein